MLATFDHTRTSRCVLMEKTVVAFKLIFWVLQLHHLLPQLPIVFGSHCVKLTSRPRCMQGLRLLLLKSGLDAVHEQGFAAQLFLLLFVWIVFS